MKANKIIFPKYYSRFKCTASLCSDNCCIGWEIDVDDETLGKYLSLSTPLGEKIRGSIKKTGGVSHFLMKNGRCPMLDDCNLCEIIGELGESGLCSICHEHPRFYEQMCGVVLGGVGMCCEAAAELILSEKKPSLYGDISELLDADDELYEPCAFVARTIADVEKLLTSDADDGEKMLSVFSTVKELDGRLSAYYFGDADSEIETLSAEVVAQFLSLFPKISDNDTGASSAIKSDFSEPKYVMIARRALSELELMSANLVSLVSSVKWDTVLRFWSESADFRRYILNSLGYLSLRYLPRAHDGDASGKLSLIVSSLVILALAFAASLSASETRICEGRVPAAIIRAAVLVSKEIEYCEENTELLASAFEL